MRTGHVYPPVPDCTLLFGRYNFIHIKPSAILICLLHVTGSERERQRDGAGKKKQRPKKTECFRLEVSCFGFGEFYMVRRFESAPHGGEMTCRFFGIVRTLGGYFCCKELLEAII